MDFDLDRFFAELDAKSSKRACAYCDGVRWEIPGGRRSVLLTVTEQGDLDLTGPVVVTVPLVCLNCGFVRLHALDYLLPAQGQV